MQTERQDIEQLLQQGKSIQIKPQGYSMYPVLIPGRDKVILEPIGARKLKRGDVVLYRRNPKTTEGILVLHRVWKHKDSGFYMVGDNQKEIEGPLSPEQMKAIMVGMIRKGKYVSCRNPWYRFLTWGWLVLRPVRPLISGNVSRIKKAFKGK